MDIQITVTDEERSKVLSTISVLNSREHVLQMPIQSIATMSGLKLSKTRLVLEDLLTKNLITRYNVSEKQVRPRYYYTLSEAALEILQNTVPQS